MPEEISVSMEESAVKDQSSASGRSNSRLLRYPLRSAIKPKEEKPPLVDSSNSISATKRIRAPSSVSKSVSVLDLSGNEKSSAKPPKRLSVPNKRPNPTSTPKPGISITPTSTSESRSKRSVISQGRSADGKSDTPRSDIFKSSARKKFSTLSSASYWLSQIKLSESSAKHSISLGFFKLALEAGCEPIHRLSDELKLYVRRNDMSEHGEFVKELFEGYKIPKSSELSHTYGNCFQEGNHFSDDDVKSSSSSLTQQKPITNADKTENAKKSSKDIPETTNDTVKAAKKSVSKKAVDIKGRSVQKKTEKLVKDKEKKQGKKFAQEEVGDSLIQNSEPVETREDDKENLDVPMMPEVTPTEV